MFAGVPPTWLNSIGQMRNLRLTLQRLLPTVVAPSQENYDDAQENKVQYCTSKL